MTYLSKLLLVFLVLLLGFSERSLGQVPIIDCNGTITCANPEPWVEYNWHTFMKYGCKINPRFKISKCCNGSNCEYIVELISIVVMGDCSEPYSIVQKEAMKFIFGKLPELANAPQFNLMKVHFKQPKCMTYYQDNWFNINLHISVACLPYDCCLAMYDVLPGNEYLSTKIVGQTPYVNNYVACDVTTEGTCDYSCNVLDFTPHGFPYEISMSDFTNVCEADCFWRLEGNNNVSPFDFIGPTNGEDFVIKTRNDEWESIRGLLQMDRVRIDKNRRIDFNLNTWNTMPQISFDSDPWGVEGVQFPTWSDPMIKLYKANGMDIGGLGAPYESYPWWITVSTTVPLDVETHGAFNIWSCPGTPKVGLENQFMTKKFTILRNGHVGIGVENPATELVVAGTICAQEVRVSLTGTPCWPDYVFADNYKLTSIDELEKFIKSNKHLPGIPNAEDVANNGVELGDMQARMLQKIEELTLYIIELKKENEEIKKMVNIKKE